MHHTGIILKTLFLAILLTACKSSIMEYSGISGLFFAMPGGSGAYVDKQEYSDESILPFALTSSEDSVFILKAKIIGEVMPYDRPVNIRIAGSESSAVESRDYAPLNDTYYVKAGEIYVDIPIHFYRNESLNGKEVTLVIQLQENESFKLPMPYWRPISNTSGEPVDVISHRITISDKYIKLPGFNEYFFGTYSEKKLRLICTISNLTLHDFVEPMTTVRAKAIGQNLDRYLKEMEAKGETVYEDYKDSEGKPVKMTSGKGIND